MTVTVWVSVSRGSVHEGRKQETPINRLVATAVVHEADVGGNAQLTTSIQGIPGLLCGSGRAKTKHRYRRRKAKPVWRMRMHNITDDIYITVSELHGKKRVDIRKYFDNTMGEQLPTKKGINMTVEQWDAMMSKQVDLRAFVDGEVGR